MDISKILKFLFPKLDPASYAVQDDSEGAGPYIVKWEVEGVDQPTVKELKIAEEAASAAEAAEGKKETAVTDRRLALDAAAAKVADPLQRARYYRERAALDLAIQAGESADVLKAILAGVNTSAAPELAAFKAELLSDEDINKSLDVKAKG